MSRSTFSSGCAATRRLSCGRTPSSNSRGRCWKSSAGPTLFCNSLEVDGAGRISGYRLRIPDGKRRAVEALRALNFRVIAAGDSYNDVGMLAAADVGILFRPPQNVTDDFPQFPVTRSYAELRTAFIAHSAGELRG